MLKIAFGSLWNKGVFQWFSQTHQQANVSLGRRRCVARCTLAKTTSLDNAIQEFSLAQSSWYMSNQYIHSVILVFQAILLVRNLWLMRFIIFHRVNKAWSKQNCRRKLAFRQLVKSTNERGCLPFNRIKWLGWSLNSWKGFFQNWR